MSGVLLMGYDVELQETEWAWLTQAFLKRAAEIHRDLNAPCTLFACGHTIENSRSSFRALRGDPLFDFQSHTYSHTLLKTVILGDQMFRAGTLEQIEAEVAKTNRILRDELGVECVGLRSPYGYYRGLTDRPDILEILHRQGIRFTSTWGRNHDNGHPVSLDVKAFWHDVQGFPDILEIPIHGWHDNAIRAEIGWDQRKKYVDMVKTLLDRAAKEDLLFTTCSHDHSGIKADPEMSILRSIMEYALERGMEILSFRHYFERMRATRAPSTAAVSVR